MTAVVTALFLLWLATLLLLALACFCNCFVSCLCPRSLRRCVCLVALLLLVGSTVFTAVATHRMSALEAAGETFIKDSAIVAQFAAKHRRQVANVLMKI